MEAAWIKRTAVVIATLAVLSGAAARAEDVEKKFRIGLMLGFLNAQDSINSDAANELRLFDRNLEFQEIYQDPRDDSSVFGALELSPGGVGTFSLQYAATKMLMIEANVGYQRTDLCCVEVQAQFDGAPIVDEFGFNFTTYRINAGEVERVPIQLGALVRFRPRASFNPYIGGGIGYSVLGFTTSDEMNQLSLNMDDSLGGQSALSPNTNGTAALTPPSGDSVVDLTGATVNVGDSFEWYVAGGAEITVAHKWALVIDFRQTFSSRSVSVGFNGSDSLGRSVPQLVDYEDSPAALDTYGAFRIEQGGLIDGGRLEPTLFAPPGTDCAVSPQQCEFVEEPDGELDLGYYYVQGGEFDYDAFSGQIGFRFTF